MDAITAELQHQLAELMSEALEHWHHQIRVNQGIAAKKTDTDYSRIKDFIAFAGDKSVNK